LRALPVGAKLRVSGIAEIDGAMQLDGSVRADGLSIALRDADDALVLVPPPFWTTSRLLAAIGLLGATLALFAVWSAMLRRRVQQQTAIIRENVRREAVWEERSRIAQDIHDDVGAALTQISLLGEIGRREGATPETMTRQLGKVVQKSRDAVRALDEIVWTVNPVNDSLEKAVSYLCQTAQDLLRETPIRCRLQVEFDLPPGTLGAKVRHNLFLAIKEALNNAVKHSGASELRFGLALEAGRLKVTIEDDGRGFDPMTANRARNGLSNMERRLADAGGSVRLDSTPGQGTRIVFEVPVQPGDTSFER
jgi:signal transduction histidine kinase